MSPSGDASSQKSDFKQEINSKLYRDETENLLMSLEKKQELKI